jgi:hypothetical protein
VISVCCSQFVDRHRSALARTVGLFAGDERPCPASPCSSSTSCFAVGNATTASSRTLIERWNGTAWQIATAPITDGDPFGDAAFFGPTNSSTFNQPIVAIARTRSSHGYWEAAIDGGFRSFGDARFYGSMGGVRLNQPVVGIAATNAGKGYWLVAGDGGIFTFGDAHFYGSMGAAHLDQPIVGLTARVAVAQRA